jgi:hypothetical protein
MNKDPIHGILSKLYTFAFNSLENINKSFIKKIGKAKQIII